MPNGFALLALIAWPSVALAIFLMLPVQRAILASIIAGYLLLPPVVALDIPGLPPVDKTVVANASAFAACVILRGRWVPLLPSHRLAAIIMLMFVLTPVASVITNREPIYFKTSFLPGMGLSDIAHSVASQIFAILPFVLARKFLATDADFRQILAALAIAGCVYSVPMLVEVRLSPQLNTWIYGFFQHDFGQMMRYGGFRPIVFLQHGLWVALFAMMAFSASIALFVADEPRHRPVWASVAGLLGIVLLLCKSVAALVYGALAAPLLLLAALRLQILVAAALGIVALGYPLLSGLDLVPTQDILQKVDSIDQERAQSLEVRFLNEHDLLERAREKPLFGWSLWGRNHIHDPETGKIVSVSDGRWIIVFGSAGLFGYIGEFGLLALPLLLLARERRKARGGELAPAAGAVALLLGFNLLDLLPNATLTPLTFLLAGALLGYVERRASNPGTQASAIVAAGPAARRPEPRRTVL